MSETVERDFDLEIEELEVTRNCLTESLDMALNNLPDITNEFKHLDERELEELSEVVVNITTYVVMVKRYVQLVFSDEISITNQQRHLTDTNLLKYYALSSAGPDTKGIRELLLEAIKKHEFSPNTYAFMAKGVRIDILTRIFQKIDPFLQERAKLQEISADIKF